MDRQANVSDPNLTVLELNQLRSCIMLRKTLLLLGSSKRPAVSKRKIDVKKNCLHWLREWGKLNLDETSLIDLLYQVITQYIFVKMPTAYVFHQYCVFHNYYCNCIVKRRETFVLKELHRLGVDVIQFRPQIDAAFIMTMENNSGNVPCGDTPIDQPSRRNVPPLLRKRKAEDAHGISQLSMKIITSRYHFVPKFEDLALRDMMLKNKKSLPHYR